MCFLPDGTCRIFLQPPLAHRIFPWYTPAVNVFSRIVQFVFILPLGVLLVLTSCSNSQGQEPAAFDKETLRTLSLEKENQTLWTRELEADRLLQDFSAVPEVAPDIQLEPRVAAAAELGGNSLYPLLQGFGSLDTAGISNELATFLTAFCASISVWNFRAEDFADSSIFSVVVFKTDVEKSWKPVFGTEFPIRHEKAAEAQREYSGDETASNGKSVPEPPKQTLFLSYIYGAPFAEDGGALVPVRFYAENGILDAALFIDMTADSGESSEGLKISQIQIVKMEAAESGNKSVRRQKN